MTWKEPPRSRTPAEIELNERILTWDIKPGDKVIVIGGYQGIVCAMLLERYPLMDLYTWEPQPMMYNVLLRRFEGVPNIHIFNSGLGIKNGVFPMANYGNDACSYIIPSGDTPNLQAHMAEFDYEMKLQGIDHITLFHMNIEGYELLLLPHLVNTGWLNRIDQLMVSTHGVIPPWQLIETTHEFLWTQRGFYGWRKK